MTTLKHCVFGRMRRSIMRERSSSACVSIKKRGVRESDGIEWVNWHRQAVVAAAAVAVVVVASP